MALALDYGPPVAAFIAASVFLFVAARAQGSDFFAALSWYRWDSLQYGDIAHGGYTISRCMVDTPQGVFPGSCGSAGWFPGYPGLIAVLTDVGLPLAAAAVALSWVFDLLALVLLWNVFLRDRPPVQSWMALIFAACCPGGIYLRAAFPLSLTTCFIVLWLWALRGGRWRWAGVAGGCAAVCYPTVVILVPLSILWGLLSRDRPLRARLVDGVQCAALVTAGFLIAVGLIAAETHKLNAWFVYQSGYRHGLHEPFAILWPVMKVVGDSTLPLAYRTAAAEAILAGFVTVVLGLGLIWRAVKGEGTVGWDLFLWLCVAAFWLIPGTQANESWWREDALLLAPAALLIARMRGDVALLLCFASLAVFPLLAYTFFTGTLV